MHEEIYEEETREIKKMHYVWLKFWDQEKFPKKFQVVIRHNGWMDNGLRKYDGFIHEEYEEKITKKERLKQDSVRSD